MVGEIAERFLTVATRAQITKLLEADRMADDQPSDRHTLGEVANWADEIKDTDWGKRRGSWITTTCRCGPRTTRSIAATGDALPRNSPGKSKSSATSGRGPGSATRPSNGSCI